jgi:hypothetical protein
MLPVMTSSALACHPVVVGSRGTVVLRERAYRAPELARLVGEVVLVAPVPGDTDAVAIVDGDALLEVCRARAVRTRRAHSRR